MPDKIIRDDKRKLCFRKYVREMFASEYLGTPVKTLRNWRFAGVGPCYQKIGRSVYYRLSDLDGFMDRHQVETEKV